MLHNFSRKHCLGRVSVTLEVNNVVKIPSENVWVHRTRLAQCGEDLNSKVTPI